MPQTTGFTIWLTGMQGAGKSTLCQYLAQRFRAIGRRVEVLDHGEVEEILLAGLESTKEGRMAATRRLGLVAKLLTRNDIVTLVAAVSPFREARDQVRREVNRFVEVHVDCPTETLIERDKTGMYKKALAGEITNFIGVTDPYETPQHPEIVIHSEREPAEECGMRVVQGLVDIGYLSPADAKDMSGRRMRPTPPAKKAAKGAKAKPAARAAKPAAKAKVAARPAKAAHKPRLAKRESARPMKKATRR